MMLPMRWQAPPECQLAVEAVPAAGLLAAVRALRKDGCCIVALEPAAVGAPPSWPRHVYSLPRSGPRSMYPSR